MNFLKDLAQGIMQFQEMGTVTYNRDEHLAQQQDQGQVKGQQTGQGNTVDVRGVPVSREEFDELAKPIVFGEVSNRPQDKKDLEARVIMNTALNRMKAHRERGTEKTLKDILTEKNQYQAYEGDQFNLYKQDNIENEMAQAKKKEVDSIMDNMWKEMEQGQFEDNTNSAYYYQHNEDAGTIEYDDQRELFAE